MTHLRSLVVGASKLAGLVWRRRAGTAALLVATEAAFALFAAHPAAAGFNLTTPQLNSPTLTMPDETVVYYTRAEGIRINPDGRCDIHGVTVVCPQITLPSVLPPITPPNASLGSASSNTTCPSAQTTLDASTGCGNCHTNPTPGRCDGFDPGQQGCGSGAKNNEEDQADRGLIIDQRWSPSCTTNWTRTSYSNNYYRIMETQIFYQNYNTYAGAVAYNDSGDDGQDPTGAGESAMFWGRQLWGGSGAPRTCSEGDSGLDNGSWRVFDDAVNTACY